MSQPPGPGNDAYGYGQGYGGYPPQGGYAQPGYPAPGAQQVDPTLAEWWQRLVARLIDGAITGVASYAVGLAILLAISVITAATVDENDTVDAALGITAFAVYFILLLGCPFLYEWLMLRSKGQTLGKMAMKIQPVNADTRQPLTSGEAAKRAAFYPLLTNLAGYLTCGIFSLLDGLWPLWDKPLAQALHDKPAHTVVIKTEIPVRGYGAPYGYPPPGPPPPRYPPQ